MCGIVGVVHAPRAGGVDASVVKRMTDRMQHRGPDGSGLWVSSDGLIALGHRRLAILDLTEAGHQPMESAYGSTVVTFNGEIYNFTEIRRQLEQRGYRFRSRCDTEVLLYLYEEYGTGMVEMLDGDFAFAIYDRRSRRALLARDRAGVHPIYYTFTGSRFLFASEIKALLADPGVSAELNPEGLYHYLTFLVAPPGSTLLRGVCKLPAGTMLELRCELETLEFRVSKYWEPLPAQLPCPEKDLDEYLEHLIDASVRKRLQSDVPVGVLFSGGVDSSLNALYFRKHAEPRQVRTYCVGMHGSTLCRSEHEEAARAARAMGTEHYEIMLSEDQLLDAAPGLASQLDEPVADPVSVPLYFVTRLARQTGTTVLHAGEGADELFCGYDNYRRFLHQEQSMWRYACHAPRPLQALAYHLFRKGRSPRAAKVADVLRRLCLGQEFFLSSSVAYYEAEKSEILSHEFKRLTAGLDSFDAVAPLYARIREARPDATFLQQLTFIELQLRLPELLLMRIDKMAMANSVEVRVPFLDRDLMDFALAVPSGFKLRDGVSKEPLKRLLGNRVGRETAYRPKTGFGVPIQEWFRGRLGRELERLLTEGRQVYGEFFSLSRLAEKLHGGVPTVNSAFQLWVVYSFVLWWNSVRSEARSHADVSTVVA